MVVLVCWVGAVERLGGSEVEAQLEDLIDKGFVRERRRPRSPASGADLPPLPHARRRLREHPPRAAPRGARLVIDWLEGRRPPRRGVREILANHATRLGPGARSRDTRCSQATGIAARSPPRSDRLDDRALAALEGFATEAAA